MILVDTSNAFIASAMVAINKSEDVLGNTCRFFLGKLRGYNLKFKDEFGELILCDDHRSWRHDAFEYYKYRRKAAKQSDEVMDHIYEMKNKTMDALREYGPYRIVKCYGAEGDDVMGVLANTYKDEDHIIVSADKDMTQLCSPTVKVFHVTKKQFIDNGPSFLKELIMTGDSGDDIPNFLSDDDTFANEEKRQRPVRKNIREFCAKYNDPTEFFDELNVKGVTTEEMIRNWKRNEQLIDLSFTPDEVKKGIIDNYNDQFNKKFDLGMLFTTLQSGSYSDKAGDFIPKTQRNMRVSVF